MIKKLTVLERELIQRLALITGYHPVMVRDVIKAQTEFVLDEIRNGTPVRLGNLGELFIYTTEYGNGYDFAKREKKPGKKTVNQIKFRPSAALVRAVKEAE